MFTTSGWVWCVQLRASRLVRESWTFSLFGLLTWMDGTETSSAVSRAWCVQSSPAAGASATHRWAIPALRTAQEIAFTAVQRELSSVVSSPVPFARRPCSMTKRVTVTTLVSKAPRSDIAAWTFTRGHESGGSRKRQDFKGAGMRNSAEALKTQWANHEPRDAERWAGPRWKHCPLCTNPTEA